MNSLVKISSLLPLATASATWQMSNFKSVTTVGGVYASSSTECYAAFSDNDQGPGVGYSNDLGDTWSLNIPYGGLNTDTARDTKGNEVLTTIGGILAAHGDQNYAHIDGRDITFSQNVESFGEQSFGVSGVHYPTGVAGEEVNGVALSTDGGYTWDFYDTGLPSDTYTTRYSAFPSDSTWYVASGSWSSVGKPLKVNPLDRNTTSLAINSRVTLSRDGPSYRQGTLSETYHWGAISKTTDGGKTFTEVYNTKGEYYFNEIDCSTTEICMAVAEDGDGAIVLRTENGGKTWENKMSVTSKAGENLMGCKMLSDSEAWVSGGTFEKGMVGHYYHTTDGGNTWDMQSLDQAYSMDLSFSGSTGCSPAMRELSSSVAVLKN